MQDRQPAVRIFTIDPFDQPVDDCIAAKKYGRIFEFKWKQVFVGAAQPAGRRRLRFAEPLLQPGDAAGQFFTLEILQRTGFIRPGEGFLDVDFRSGCSDHAVADILEFK